MTTLMATPSARGLFASAIAQSAPTNAVYSRALAAEWAAQFVEILYGRTVATGTRSCRESTRR